MVVNYPDSISGSPIIQLKEVTLDYGGDVVVSGANLEIKQGETKVILGPSGVGKSTILKAVLGLLRPRTGEVFIHGMGISKLPERELVKVRLRMAMVFQHGALFDSMTVGENVSFRLREHGMANEDEMDQRVLEVLKFVGLEGTIKLKPAQLSGGMKKRVAIARAIAPDPRIILFDEPTTGLDPINLYNIEQLILKLKKRQDTAMVVVTHDIESTYRFADSVVVLHEGKFIFEGTPETLKANQDKRVQCFLNPGKEFG